MTDIFINGYHFHMPSELFVLVCLLIGFGIGWTARLIVEHFLGLSA